MGTNAHQLSRPLSARVHGTALVLYFALLPYVVFAKWQRTSDETSGSLIRALLVILARSGWAFCARWFETCGDFARGGA